MANIPIWSGSAGPISGSTPFGFYDNDSSYQIEGPQFARWAAERLGYPIVNIELQDINFYAALEEAVTTYGNEIYQYKVRENYLSMEGNSTGSSFNNQLVTPNLGSVIRISETYASEAGAGGYTNYYTCSFALTASVQDYDLNAILAAKGITGSAEIKRVFYEEPPAIVRYFDPYAGTGTGIQSLLESFGFGQFSPGINFLLMPIYFDVQKIQSIELNDQIRKSAFSFDIHNNKLRIFPIPEIDKMLLFHYILIDERNSVVASSNGRTDLITNIGNVPYENPVFSQLNAIGKQWIRQYALALVKEMLAYVRGKYQTTPIPGAEVSLNQQDLLTDARDEKAKLLEQLRATLDMVSRKTQLENQVSEAQSVQQIISQIPLPIYVF